MKFLKKFFESRDSFLRSQRPKLTEVSAWEPKLEKLSLEDLKSSAKELKKKVKTLDDATKVLPEAFALVRETAKRTLGQRPYDEQVLGAIALHQGKIIEMKTGEGKTLAATMPVFLNALIGKGVHVITVNDYLAQRDAVWMGQIYHSLGLTVGCVIQEAAYLYSPVPQIDQERDQKGSFEVFHQFLKPAERKHAYQADITYGTNNVFGFDYLRDNLVVSLEQKVQRGFYYAILDEVDSILIDEARTPLIISSPDSASSQLYQKFAGLVRGLQEERDFQIDHKRRSVSLTEAGIARVEKILNLPNLYQPRYLDLVFHLEQALKAMALFKRDKDYVVKGGQVVIVDEFTGRLMPDRRFSEGLHQALEAKEGLEVKEESRTLATVSFQNFFRKYERLCGMTGTALTSQEEFYKVYGLEVVEIPTHKKLIRKDWDDRVYQSEAGKFKAVISEIKQRHKAGQPVLVGTVSIEKNERISQLLSQAGIPHQLLNAKQHEKEASVIAQAGRKGMVTVATNMAGRGVDIILGGNPPDAEEAKIVKELGGLFVLGTERHEARRIDDQLRGRSGRQGDPGESRFFVSMEDDLIKAFGPGKAKALMERLGLPEDQPIENPIITKSISSAQRRIEGYNFDLRKHLLQYDEVINIQRDVIYQQRDEILFELKNNPEKLWERTLELFKEKKGISRKSFLERFKEQDRQEVAGVFARVMLGVLDNLWTRHLSDLDYLRTTIGLRAYGQKDPLAEYRHEAQRAYKEMLEDYRSQAAEALSKLKLEDSSLAPAQETIPLGQVTFSGPVAVAGTAVSGQGRQAGQFKGAGRNDPCPCGSGKKFKKCHGR
jgi:preprotein translocase subunit SecA